MTLDLRTITPVVGGGVSPFEPDETDAVRVPGIRGQLRWWWRQLYARAEESADDLFRREALLWGGVDVGKEAATPGKSEPGLRSLVQVQAEVLAPGTIGPPGEHQLKEGKPKAAAHWFDGNELGYALFPLQRQEEERKLHRSALPLPTRSVRRDLRFRLSLIWRGHPSNGSSASAVREVLATLWVWAHLGGIGARTRRGFGALQLDAAELHDLPSELATGWLGLFDPPKKVSLADGLRRLAKLAAPENPTWPPHLVSGECTTDPVTALKELLGALQKFRQGKNDGRDPGTRFPVGRSRWPEPNLLRLLVDPSASWEHSLPKGLEEQVEAMGAPRAAFGLPIEAKFKKPSRQDPGTTADEQANARILPVGYERWASPVLLRPVQEGQRYRPLVLVLGGARPQRVRIVFEKGTTKEVHVASPVGSRNVIATRLSATNGDAVAAFIDWLQDTRRFQALSVTAPTGGPHA